MQYGITPRELARRHFGEFTEKGGEIIPTICPFCRGGQHRDKNTFALNIDTGAYNCRRGSCGESGSFYMLKQHFGEVDKTANYEYKRDTPKKSFTPSTVQILPLGQKAIEYLASRGISRATAERFGVGDDGKGNIVFSYVKDGTRVAVKYRPARVIKPGEQKLWRETGTDTTTLFGMQNVDGKFKTLVITEGEFDALSLAEIGVPYVASVPNGSQDFGWVEANWEWLEQFKTVAICGDADEPGRKMVTELVKRLGQHKCSVVSLPPGCKDANETLVKHGSEVLSSAIANAQPVPIAGLLRLADVEAFDLRRAERIKTNLKDLDKAIGGLFMGQCSVITGSNGCGKSTLLGQILLEAVQQEYPVCCFSGELPAALFRYWVDLQAAGPLHIQWEHDEYFGAERPSVSAEDSQKIRAWYRDKFFLYDNSSAINPDSVFEVFEYAAQRYGCRLFVVDNLMMLSGNADSDYYRGQSDFMRRCVAFAKRFKAHVIVCAHPRKAEGRLTKLDISGTADISNLADNVISLYRLNAEDKSTAPGDAVLDVFKSRFSGQQDIHIGLSFDSGCKRFYQYGDRLLLDRIYGWEVDSDGFYEISSDTAIPFSEV